MQSYWGIDHGDVISKSQKLRGAAEGGVTGAAIGAGSTYGARRMLIANSVMQQRGYVPMYETEARAKKIIPNKKIGKVGAAGLGVGAAVGAYKKHKS